VLLKWCDLLIACSELEKKFHAMKDDLITRLQNACGQRDEARAQVSVVYVCVCACVRAYLSVYMCVRVCVYIQGEHMRGEKRLGEKVHF